MFGTARVHARSCCRQRQGMGRQRRAWTRAVPNMNLRQVQAMWRFIRGSFAVRRPPFRQDLAHALRREAERDEHRADIGDLAILGDLPSLELHHRHALEADAFARPRQGRDVAERVVGIERAAVAQRTMHVPAEIARRAVEPVVDQPGDLLARPAKAP